MCFPVEFFPVLFAIPRASDWLAQWPKRVARHARGRRASHRPPPSGLRRRRPARLRPDGQALSERGREAANVWESPAIARWAGLFRGRGGGTGPLARTRIRSDFLHPRQIEDFHDSPGRRSGRRSEGEARRRSAQSVRAERVAPPVEQQCVLFLANPGQGRVR